MGNGHSWTTKDVQKHFGELSTPSQAGNAAKAVKNRTEEHGTS